MPPARIFPKSRSEATIAQVATETCYSAAEIIRASNDPKVRRQLQACKTTLFNDRWIADPEEGERVWIMQMLALCMMIHDLHKGTVTY